MGRPRTTLAKLPKDWRDKMNATYAHGDKVPRVSGVYVLLHPDTREVRYVGQSKNIAKRYSGHLSLPPRPHYPVSLWIVKLAREGKTPRIAIVEETHDRFDAERRHIAAGRAAGLALLNLHDGGKAPACVGNGCNAECWSVRGAPDPYTVLRRTAMNAAKRIPYAKTFMGTMRDRYAECTDELSRTRFMLTCCEILMETWPRRSGAVTRWAERSADQINAKFPGTIILRYCGGA